MRAADGAAALAGVDVVYVTAGVIPPVSLLDAAAEIVLLTGRGLIAWQSVPIPTH